jgi:hypothetical protein
MSIHGYVGNIITANPTAPTSTVASGVWTTEQQLIAVAAGNWPFTIPTQQISRSLRFNRPDSAYLNRTFSTGNRKTWTWSCWIKRSTLDVGGGDVPLISSVGASSTYDSIRFNSDSTFRIYYSGGAAYAVAISGSPVFRDVSAWYHIVVAQDTTQATEANRLRVWINGVQQTLTGIPAQNYESGFNNGVQHEIGKQYIQSEYFPGYMAEAYFIGGSALTPSSFGRTSTTTGVWEPIAYTGSYAGTNSFYLPFSDNASTTTLGDDFSGNNNDWTLNNFSVTAGAGNDSLVDSPTAYGTDTGVGGEVRGNYCTLNPLQTTQSATAPTNGNLTSPANAGVWRRIGCTIQLPTTGKWYFEYNCDSFSSFPTFNIGVFSGNIDTSNNAIGFSATEWGYDAQSGYAINNNTTISSGFTTATTGDVLQLAYDASTGSIWFGKNNTWQGASSPNPSTGTSPTYTGVYNVTPVMVQNWATLSVNFGQRAFAYTAPSGFKALCTTNLPTPTIGATSTTQANQYFDIELWTGDDTVRTITFGMQPDLIWTKGRNAAVGNRLSDSVRGASGGLMYNLVSNSTAAENTDTAVTGIVSTGITLTSGNHPNNTGTTYVGWGWKANGAGSSNTSGTITSTVSANTTSGFSIVTYTGTGSNATVGHGLGVAPSMIIVKNRGVVENWPVYHASTTATGRLILDGTDAFVTTATTWNSTAPTSTVFSVGSSIAVNGSGNGLVAYCFAAVAGYSAFGSYTGNAAADGPFIYTGFRPEFVMIKASSSTGDWVMQDVARSPYNVSTNYLVANASTAEQTGQLLDFVSNGFKIRVAVSGAMNGSGTTYIYMAFAENPFKYALAR